MGGWAIDADKKLVGTANKDIERDDTIDRVGIGRNLAIEEFVEMAIERAVRAAQHVVGQLEVGDENPCVEGHCHLRDHQIGGTS